MGRQAPAPTPSRLESATAKRARPAPRAALARGLIAVVARLRSREGLVGIAGSSGTSVTCGAVQGAVGRPSLHHGRALAASPRPALQPTPVRVEDLEEHHQSAIVLQVDREGAPCSATPSDLT